MNAYNLRYSELFFKKKLLLQLIKQIDNEMELIIQELNMKCLKEKVPSFNIMKLLEVPNDVFQQQILQYLTIHDIGRLDNAMINHSVRDQYQQKLSNTLILENINFKDISLLCWIGKRNIRMKKVSISIYTVSEIIANANIVNPNIIFQFCEDLSIKRYYSIDDIMAIVTYFKSLKSLSLYYKMRITSANIKFILSKFVGLQTLQIDSLLFDDSIIELEDDYCPGICNLSLTQGMISLAHYCKRLQSLDLSFLSKLTDTHINTSLIAQNCTELKFLNLSKCNKLTDASIILLSQYCSRLQTLNLSFCYNITDISIISVAEHCSDLKSLNLRECDKITDASIISITENCLDLQSLDLSICRKITDASIISVAEHCSGLQYLNLSICKKLTDASIISISIHCKGLQSLSLSYCHNITDISIISVAEHCSDLESLNLRECNKITDASIISITENCLDLQYLDLSICPKITDESIISIAIHCKGLQKLFLGFCSFLITKMSILLLAHNCRRLQSFELSRTNNSSVSSDSDSLNINSIKKAITVLPFNDKIVIPSDKNG